MRWLRRTRSMSMNAPPQLGRDACMSRAWLRVATKTPEGERLVRVAEPLLQASDAGAIILIAAYAHALGERWRNIPRKD
jgi:hypothetical protein